MTSISRRLLPLVTIFLIPVIYAQTVNVLCSELFCSEQTAKEPCEELPKTCRNSSATMNGILMLDPSTCNCCDYCLQYLEKGDDCVINGKGQPIHEYVCGPGLMCDKDGGESPICVPLISECTTKQKVYDQAKEDGLVGFTELRPLCDERGNYYPVHCIGGSICYCVNPQGERIFGERVYSHSNVPEEMTCECSLAAWKAEQLAIEAGVYSQSFHCLEDGSYDRLQCNNDMCRCLMPETNLPEDGYPVLEINIMDGNPECFRANLHETGKYNRECEERAEQLVFDTKYLLEEEDIVAFGMRIPKCQYDGRYSRVMVMDTEKICVDPDGIQLENFKASHGDPLSVYMDCNCARTQWLMKHEDITELPNCCTNGNFRSMQCRRGLCFCVDCNGNQLGIEVKEDEKHTLPCSDADNSCSRCDIMPTIRSESSTFTLKPLGLDKMFAVEE